MKKKKRNKAKIPDVMTTESIKFLWMRKYLPTRTYIYIYIYDGCN